MPNEVNLALKLIESLTAEFDPAKYHDTYTEDVKKLIEDNAKGQKREAPPPKPAPQQCYRLGCCRLAGEPGAKRRGAA